MADERRGRFITFEGGEGTGKSTQARLLADALTAAGCETVLTREPGGAPGAEQIRSLLVDGARDRWDPFTETLLHITARHEHVARTIDPALGAGKWVVCDRFVHSTRAYQGAGMEQPLGVIDALHDIVLGDLRPDLTVILDIAVETGLERALGRGTAAETRYEAMDMAFHRRVRDAFLEMAAAASERMVVIDAGDTVEAIAASVRREIASRFDTAFAEEGGRADAPT